MSSIHTQATQETRSTCPYCGVGCGVIIETRGHLITGVRGDPEHPANFGRLCSKGSTLHLSAKPEVTQQTRLLTPQVRLNRTDAFTHTPWDAALQQASDKIAQVVADHGLTFAGRREQCPAASSSSCRTHDARRRERIPVASLTCTRSHEIVQPLPQLKWGR